jgi:ferritin-like protein
MAARSDTETLEDLLAREQRLLSAYEAALRRDAIDPALGETLRDHERAHVRALEQTLAGAGRRNPRASVPSAELTAALRDRDTFAQFAMRLEEETRGMYIDAAARMRDADLRRPLGSIMACGAAHVVALKDSLGIFLVN